MSAFLARLDGHLFTALFHLADLLLDLDSLTETVHESIRSTLERGIQRTPIKRRPPSRHRLARSSYVRTWRHPLRGVPVRFDHADYEWGLALKSWACRTERNYLQWQ